MPARDSIYTPELGEAICDRISKGETLRSICRDLGVHFTTVYGWMREDAALALRFAQAREVGYDMIAQETLAIADTPLMGEETETSEHGLKIKRSDMLGHRKLQIETRLKLLAKWSPKKYGDKIEVDANVKVDAVGDLRAFLGAGSRLPISTEAGDAEQK